MRTGVDPIAHDDQRGGGTVQGADLAVVNDVDAVATQVAEVPLGVVMQVAAG